MRLIQRIAWMAAAFGLFLALPGPFAELHGQQPGAAAGGGRGQGEGRGRAAGAGGRGQIEAWAPMPVKPNPFTPPHKALTRLTDVLAKHKGQQNWSHLIVDDNLFHGSYISMAPGAKTPRRFHQDNRAFWIVQAGQIRFTIEGQEPFVASKGFLVHVPKRLIYSMETVGDQPSLRFEVLMANSHIMYPADETPTPMAGVKYERTRVANAKGAYDDANVPYIDYNLTIAGTPKPKRNQNQFLGDAHDGGYVNVGISNIIRGDPKTQKPAQPGDKGHFHLTGPEFWFMLEGQNEFLIGSEPIFIANQGDIVYAPAQTWHRPRHVGDGMATRLAIVGYANSHVYSAEGPGNE
jgi:mannose-6-phosphate isomerase-like protein (cupin superfamily)